MQTSPELTFATAAFTWLLSSAVRFLLRMLPSVPGDYHTYGNTVSPVAAVFIFILTIIVPALCIYCIWKQVCCTNRIARESPPNPVARLPVTNTSIVSGSQSSSGPGQRPLYYNFREYHSGSEQQTSQASVLRVPPVALGPRRATCGFQASSSESKRTMRSNGETVPFRARAPDVNNNKKQIGSSRELQTCSICLEPLTRAQHDVTLPCSHVFHESCGISWLTKSNTCPLCRRSVHGRRGG